MLTGIGIYVLGLIVFIIIGFILGVLAEDFAAGTVTVMICGSLVGIYFIGDAIAKLFNLI